MASSWRAIFSGAALLLWLGGPAQTQPLTPEDVTRASMQEAGPRQVITHVTVIDPSVGADERHDMTVVVRGERIETLGPFSTTPIPPGAVVHDASGRYLIPGLWDAHVHLTQTGPRDFPLFIANGVTSVRDMSSVFGDIQQWRAARAAGAAIPRILSSGPKLDGATPDQARRGGQRNARSCGTSPQMARATVADLKRQGVDFIKVHNGMTPDLYDAIVSASLDAGLPFAGHTPIAGPIVAANAGQRTIEHGWRMLPCSPQTWDRIRTDPTAQDDAQFCAPLDIQADMFPALVRAHVWFTPTLVSWRGAPMVGDPGLEAWIGSLSGSNEVWPALRRHWVEMSEAPLGAFERTLVNQHGELTKAAARAGVHLLAGTDLGDPFVIPGYSLHDELELMVAAGVPILTALQSATSEPATAFGVDATLGSISIGQLADMVILNADPLIDIRNTRSIHAVILNGRWISH